MPHTFISANVSNVIAMDTGPLIANRKSPAGIALMKDMQQKHVLTYRTLQSVSIAMESMPLGIGNVP